MLVELFHDLNHKHFAGSLPLPKLAWNSRLSSTAGRFCPRGVPHLDAHASPALIEVASYLREIPEGSRHIRDTVLHEMIHYWLWIRRRPYGHTKEFYIKMRETGAKRFNPVPKERPVRYQYVCMGCGGKVPARRRLSKDVACYQCCKKYNRGQFHAKFRLYLVDGLETVKPDFASKPLAESAPLPTITPFVEVVERLKALRAIVSGAKIRSARNE